MGGDGGRWGAPANRVTPHRSRLAAGLALARECGLQQDDLVEVLKLGAIACPMFALKGPAMAAGAYPPAFPLKHQQKDMR